MTAELAMDGPITVEAENVGGIERSSVSLPPGVTVLTGRNATNRTSFLQAIMAALGSDRASLKADADEGQVTFDLGEETYTRQLERRNGTVRFDGEPYLDDPELADLFAFLLENNEARRAVERGDDLREVIMRPIDTAEIEREIADAKERKREIDEELDRLDRLEDELPQLTSERTTVENELESTREELAAVEADLEDVDVDPAESKDRKEELEDVFAELRDARASLEDVEFELETEQATVEELEAERDSLEENLADAEGGDGDVGHLEDRIEELRSRKRTLDRTINELQSVVGFNEEMLEGDGFATERAFDGGTETTTDDVTDQLVADDTTTCWTCGSAVETERIEETIDRLRSLRSEKLTERNEVTDELDELKARRDELRETKTERERTERRLDAIEEDLSAAHDRIEELEAEREALEETVADLDAETEEFEETDYSEALELHREANRLELEVERLESNRDELADRIEEYEAELDRRSELQDRRESVQEELTDLRTRVDRIEDDAVESFNEHMASILDILDYDNIERIWIEHREVDGGGRGGNSEQSTFDLHVVRATNGSAYRDSVEHLSESEREVTGLVFALAGYLVHDVHEIVPFMLLDSLEAIDSNRIAALVEYFEDHVGYLVVALLPEDAQALSDDYAYVEEI